MYSTKSSGKTSNFIIILIILAKAFKFVTMERITTEITISLTTYRNIFLKVFVLLTFFILFQLNFSAIISNIFEIIF